MGGHAAVEDSSRGLDGPGRVGQTGGEAGGEADEGSLHEVPGEGCGSKGAEEADGGDEPRVSEPVGAEMEKGDVGEVHEIADLAEVADGAEGKEADEPAAAAEGPEKERGGAEDGEGVVEAVALSGVGDEAKAVDLQKGEESEADDAANPGETLGDGLNAGALVFPEHGDDGAGAEEVCAEGCEEVDGEVAGEEGCGGDAEQRCEEDAEGRDDEDDALAREQDDQGPEEVELLFNGERPDGKERCGAVEEVVDVHAEEDEEGPGGEHLPGDEGSDGEADDDIGREDAEGAADVEVAEVGGVELAMDEDAGDEEAGKDEEDVDAGPKQGDASGVVEEDGEHGHGTEAVELRDSVFDGGDVRGFGRLDGHALQSRISES